MNKIQKWQAIRASLYKAYILDQEQKKTVDLEWPSRGISSCENTLIGDPFHEDRRLGVYPRIQVGSSRYIVRRKLLTKAFFRNSYELLLVGDDNREVAKVLLRGGIFERQEISFGRTRYELQRGSLFRFDYRIFSGSESIIHITESTPFWTFSSRRVFELSVLSDVDPAIIGLAFYLSHNQFF